MDYTTVYQYFAANGALIYVGITNRGTRRLHEHADSKPWWHLATGCTLEHFETRDAALAREAELIVRYRPPYNTQLNPDRHLSVEDRVRTRLRVADVKHLDQGPAAIKRRRKAWYQLSKEQRLVAPCVTCGQRPGITGPACLQCVQLRARTLPSARELRLELEAEAQASLAADLAFEAQHPRLQGDSALKTPMPPETPERVAISTPERA